jgi:hypothetical protein
VLPCFDLGQVGDWGLNFVDFKLVGHPETLSVVSALLLEKSLISVSLEGLGEKAVEQLFSGICQNSSIQNIELSRSTISDESMDYMEGFLKMKSCTLSSLVFCLCEISPIGFTSLFNGLSKNSSLCHLSISNNGTAEGMRLLADVLKENSSLTSLTYRMADQEPSSQFEASIYANDSLVELSGTLSEDMLKESNRIAFVQNCKLALVQKFKPYLSLNRVEITLWRRILLYAALEWNSSTL